jgi:transposase-like protein
MMELEVEDITNAKKYERTDERETSRNGYRARTFKTGVGELTLAVPKLRAGTYFPTFLEPRRMVQGACQRDTGAYINVVSTRKVERLVRTWT